MAILNQKRILNLIPKVSAPVTIHVSQGDVGTEIEFTLVKGDEVFVNPGNVTASVHGVREDGANFGPFTCTLSGSKVIFPLHPEMTAVKGSALAEIVLVDNSGNKVGSANFGILVEESVFPLGVNYDNDVSVYESILAYVQSSAAQIVGDYTSKINVVQSGLNNEIATRTSEDALINERIDEIIAPSGEAPSAAEVTDARIDADGITHASLGRAIRYKIGMIEDSDGFFRGPWARKTIMSNGQLDNSTTRLAMSARYYIEKDGVIIAKANGQKYWFYTYDDATSDASYNDGHWNTNIRIIPINAGKYINVVVAKTTDGTIWPQERAATFNYLPIKIVETSDIEKISQNFEYWKEVKNKRATVSVGRPVAFYDDDKRLSTPNLLYADSTITITFPNTYRVNVITTNADGVVTSETNWQSTTQTIAAGSYFHLAFRRADDGIITFNEITNYTFSDGSKKQLDYVLSLNNELVTNRIDQVEKDTTKLKNDFNVFNENIVTVSSNIRGIAHRGMAVAYPENTITAFIAARKAGFKYVEFDVQTTSDGVFVILHDTTINRTARNADGSEISTPISINSISYADALTYDFGIYKGEKFAGTKIPTLEETLSLCHDLGISPIIEMKYTSINTQSLVNGIIDLTKKYNLQHDCYFSVVSYPEVLEYVQNVLPDAKLFWCGWNAFSNNDLIVLNNLKKPTNEVICSIPLSLQTTESLQNAIDAGYPIANAEAVNYISAIEQLPKCLTWIYSEAYRAENVLYSNAINQ